MNRLKAKCLVTSAVTHAALVVLVIVAPMLMGTKPEVDSAHVIQLVNVPDAILTDGASSGGGTPNAATLRPAPQPPAPLVEPTPVAPQREDPPAADPVPPPEPVRPPDPPVIERDIPDITPAPVKKTTPVKRETPKPPPAPKASRFDPKSKNVRSSDAVIKSSQRASTKKSEGAEAPAPTGPPGKSRAEAIGAALGRYQDGVGGTEIGTVGPGGQAFRNYADVIRELYEANLHFVDNRVRKGLVSAEVTIARNGRLLKARIKSPSSDAVINKTVQNVLDRVIQFPPFPTETKDLERTFNIRFNLEATQGAG